MTIVKRHCKVSQKNVRFRIKERRKAVDIITEVILLVVKHYVDKQHK